MNVDVTSLAAAPDAEHYELHLAAIEHSLLNAIIINDASDIQSARHWSERFKPFEHQVRNLITFCRRAPVALIADDVGLGKTISAGLILSELMTRGKVRRTLVVAPGILLPQWRSELRSKFGVAAEHRTGAAIREVLRDETAVVVTTYQTASRYIGEIRDGQFDMLILDEAHKVKSLHGPNPPAQMALRIRQALADNVFKFALMLTATPIQNNAWDLYSLIDALAVARFHPNPLGPPDEFAARFLQRQGTKGKPKYLRQDRQEQFRSVVSGYMMRATRRNTSLPFPQRVVSAPLVRATGVENRMLALLQSHVDRLLRVEALGLALAMMSSPAAFARQMAVMATKERLWLAESADEAKRIARASPLGAKAAKLTKLIAEVRAAQGDAFRMVVFTNRRATQEAIAERLQEEGVQHGLIRGANALANQRTIDAFNEDPPGVNMIVSTDAGAEGVNLQKANVVVNYDLPWNPMVVEQRIGRVQRLGSDFADVHVMNLAVADTAEQLVVQRLMLKLQTASAALGDLEAIIEAAGNNWDEDGLEKEVQDTVYNWLRKLPIEERLKKIEANIEHAQQVYREEKRVVDETLGDGLDAIHKLGPRMPPLTPVKPRIGVREFVERAYRADGALVEPMPEGRFRIRPRGQLPMIATFDPADPELRRAGQLTGLSGANVQLFQEGSRAFEQLVGAWMHRRTHRSAGEPIPAEAVLRGATQAWFDVHGDQIEVRRADSRERSRSFNGTVAVRTSVAVAHDRLERLLEIPVGEPDLENDAPADAILFDDLQLGRVQEFDAKAIEASVVQHEDLRRFADFYQERLAEEKRKRPDENQQRTLEENFTPSFAAEIQGARGMYSERAQIEVTLRVEARGPYKAEFLFNGTQVEVPPKMARCAVTGYRVPEAVLEPCAITGVRALPDRLVASASSGRRAVPEQLVVCELSGVSLLRDEVRERPGGGYADAALFAKCAVTGGEVLKSTLQQCAFTGALVLPEHLIVSDLSHKPARRDQVQTCVVTGMRGHVSELGQCSETQRWALPSELARSEVSGKNVLKSLLLPSPKSPNRFALAREFIRCALSGVDLLPDQAERCNVTGRFADRGLMAVSERSGLHALPEVLVTCERSGRRLLPSEIGKCHATGERIDRELLAQSDFSQELVFSELLRTCPETGKRGLEEEMVQCEVSQEWIDPKALVTCAQSGALVRRGLTVKCAKSGQPVRVELAVRTHSGALALRKYVETCVWSGEAHLQSELTRCSVYGIAVAPAYITMPTRLSALRDARNPSLRFSTEGEIGSSLVRVFRSFGHAVRDLWITPAPRDGIAQVFFRADEWLGFVQRHYASIVNVETGDVLAGPVRVE